LAKIALIETISTEVLPLVASWAVAQHD